MIPWRTPHLPCPPRPTAPGAAARALVALLAGCVAAVALATAPAAEAAPAVRIVGISSPLTNGVWLAGSRGEVQVVGAAPGLGSHAGRPLARPVVGTAGTPSGRGYWLVAADGGIFTFGDARFHGSTGARRLNKPIVGMAATPSGRGYWLVAADGGIFTFGDARFHGSTGGRPLASPVVGMAATATGRGYWLAGADGTVLSFGDAPAYGSAPRSPAPVVGIAARPKGLGYVVARSDGSVSSFALGSADHHVPAPPPGATRQAHLWPFSSTSPWNLPVGSGARYESANDLRTRNLLDPSVPAWVNAGQYSHPIYRASSSDPWATVRRPGHPDVRYQIPSGATPAGGSDQHMHVIEPNGRWLNESWLMQGRNPDWTTGYHRRTDLHGTGMGEGGVRAYGGSAIGGLIRGWELEAGVIRHSLALGITNRQLRHGWVWPAIVEDGNGHRAYHGHNPMGTFAAIPPSVDVRALGLSREGQIVARALQDHGAYVVDRAGAFTLFTDPGLERSPAVANLRADMAKIRAQLRVVSNNSPSSVNGGGTPRTALAPPLG
jgi:hypothetical protein